MEHGIVLDNFFKCQMPSDDAETHILNDPRVLPCGYTMCKECILNAMQANDKKFKCNFDNCQREHLIADIDQLGKNHLVAKVLTENINYLSNDLLKKLQAQFQSFIGKIEVKIYD